MNPGSPRDADLTPDAPLKTTKGHPPGLYLLFLVEMWERFSYYGMRGLLVLYLISVTAPHQLSPGVYTNTLKIEEFFAAIDGSTAPIPNAQPGALVSPRTVSATHTHTVSAVVGSAAAPAATEPGLTGMSRLVIQRLVPATGEGASEQWTLAPPGGGATTPMVTRVTPGDRSGYADTRFGFQITNPGNEPIEIRFGMDRSGGGPILFTANDATDTVSATIKPDSERKAGEEPFRVVVAVNQHDSGRSWTRGEASTLYGWYTGLAYLFPVIGGMLADKLIGTHRSMVIGGLLIALGHVVLGISGLGDLALNNQGMALFILGLGLIVLGTGHFKPCVSVMVGQLYPAGDPRRDGAFTIFYMGINLGAFICAFVCGSLGEKVGWHYGFAAAAVGMLLGLAVYVVGRPMFLKGIGEAPKSNASATSAGLFVVSCVLATGFAGLYFTGAIDTVGHGIQYLVDRPALGYAVVAALMALILGWVGWFLSINRPEDRGPVVTIFVFMLFNAFFWVAFEQAGSSVNVFTEQNTDRMVGSFEVPATWFQSVNSLFIIALAPLFAWIWTALGRRSLNPSQPVKIALGLIFLGIGYLFMVRAGQVAVGGAVKASMMLLVATYFWHTVGELCLSPTGLSYVTKAAPARFVSLLMGIWFISSFIANLAGGLIAAQVEAIERGEITLPWNFGGQADFFFLFVVTSIGAGLVILALTPVLKPLMGGRDS